MFWRVNAGSNSSVLVRGGHFVNMTEELQRMGAGSDQALDKLIPHKV